MNETKQSTADLAMLDQLNKDYVHSDQFNDVKRFSEFLAEDFIVQSPTKHHGANASDSTKRCDSSFSRRSYRRRAGRSAQANQGDEVARARDAHQSKGARWERVRRIPRSDSVDAGLRVLREAEDDRLGSCAHRARLVGADEASRIQAIRCTGRGLGGSCYGSHGEARAAGAARHSHQHAGGCSPRRVEGDPIRRPAAQGHVR
jgi:hypothetical protein